MKIGYIRISTTDQNTARQEVLMRELAVLCLMEAVTEKARSK